MANSDTSARTIQFYENNARFFSKNWSSLFALPLLAPVILYREKQKRVVKILSIFSGGLFLLYASFFIYPLYRLLFRSPVIVINEQGIFYNPYAPWFVKLKMSIRWEEIAALYVDELTMHSKKRTHTDRLLAVLPKDEEAYFQREKMLSLRRTPILVLWSITKTPFMLYEQVTAPTSSHELLTLITDRFSDKIQANGIEIREEQKTVFERK